MVFMTIDGHAVERTPREYPYSYTRFCLWKNGYKKTDMVAWSDRLRDQYENFDEIKNKVLGIGGYFSRCKPEDIQEFMRKLMKNDAITVTGMEEECNAMNGYPYWLIYFRIEEVNEK